MSTQPDPLTEAIKYLCGEIHYGGFVKIDLDILPEIRRRWPLLSAAPALLATCKGMVNTAGPRMLIDVTKKQGGLIAGYAIVLEGLLMKLEAAIAAATQGE